MKIEMDLIKKLRDATFAPLKDCREVLIEAEGDLEKAQEILRKKGAAQAAKKADRETNEGVVKFVYKNGTVLGIKIGCETDFVAKNDIFVQMVNELIEKLGTYTKEASHVSELDPEFFAQLDEHIKQNIGRIGENLKLLDVIIRKGTAYVYNHPGDKVSAAVFYTSSSDKAETLAKDVALQIAAMNPQYLSIDSIPSSQIEELKKQFTEELMQSGKPADMIAKIVEGKVMKAVADNILLEQPSIRDDSKKVKEIIGSELTIEKFIRIAI